MIFDIFCKRRTFYCDRPVALFGDTAVFPAAVGPAVRRPPVVRRWSTRGPPVVRPWSARGPPVVRPWSSRGPPVVLPWSARGPPVVCPWSARGVPVVCPWSARGVQIIGRACGGSAIVSAVCREPANWPMGTPC